MSALDIGWERVRTAIEAACSEAQAMARRKLIADLNQIFRRLRHYGSEDQFMSVLRDGAAQHADSFGIFSHRDGFMRARVQHNLALPENLEFPLGSAHAFAAAIELQEPVAALCTPSEVGAALQAEQPAPRAHLFPIANNGRSVAVLFALDNGNVNVSGLELLTQMAAAVLERHSNYMQHAHIALPAHNNAFAPANAKASPAQAQKTLPSWADLKTGERGLHIKAQRFARVIIAEMQLTRPETSRAGRAQSNFYILFRQEIDKARETFRKQFMTVPSMVDYLHLELVRTAASGEEDKLGVDYPGPLV